MDIYLDHLGHRQQLTLLQWRVNSFNGQSTGWRLGNGLERGLVEKGLVALPAGSRPASPQLGWLGRLWSRGTGSSPEVTAAGLDALRSQNLGMLWGMNGGAVGFWMPAFLLMAAGAHYTGLFMMLPGAIMSGTGLLVPGYFLRRVCRPAVTAEEVQALEALMPDELERAYLRLVEDAVRQQVTPETAKRVRAALQAIAEAIDRLPTATPPRASAEALLAEAEQARSEARNEQDTLIAASYERKSEALTRSALAAQRSQMLVRRAAALREEMLAQIESLRLGLAGFDTTSGAGSGLDALADAVRTVATESIAVTDARAELDSSLAGPSPFRKPAAEADQSETIQRLSGA